MEKFNNNLKSFNKATMYPILFIVVISFCIFSSIFSVGDGATGVIRTFGKVTSIVGPGIHFKFPYPIQKIDVIDVNKVRTLEVGYKNLESAQSDIYQKRDSQILTKGENLVWISMTVDWKVSNPTAFLFNSRDPESILKNSVLHSARNVISDTYLESVITDGKTEIQNKTKEHLKKLIASYNIGIEITDVKLKEAKPPLEVKKSFEQISNASEQKNTLINKANEYTSQKISDTEEQIKKDKIAAESYREERLNKAKAETATFNSLYNEYKISKDVTRTRLLLETLEEVLPGCNIIISDSNGNTFQTIPADNATGGVKK